MTRGMLGIETGFGTHGHMAADWIRDLETAESQSRKQVVIEKAVMSARLGSASAQCFLFNCYLALNPYHPHDLMLGDLRSDLESSGPESGCENPWGEFWGFLEGLRTRSNPSGALSSVADFRETVHDFMHRFDKDEWNLVARRVMFKDLLCGVTLDVFNSVCQNTPWAVPKFSCQMPQTAAESPQYLRGRCLLEPYLEGERILTLVMPPHLYSKAKMMQASCRFYDSQGQSNSPDPGIRRDLVSAMQFAMHIDRYNRPSWANGPMFLDGVIVQKPGMHSIPGEWPGRPVYYIFDIIPFAEFRHGRFDMPLERRHLTLQHLSPAFRGQVATPVPGLLVDLSTAEGLDVMRRYARDAGNQGHSGIVVKNWAAPYQRISSPAWITVPTRLKPDYLDSNASDYWMWHRGR